jgi:hypothetical protein
MAIRGVDLQDVPPPLPPPRLVPINGPVDKSLQTKENMRGQEDYSSAYSDSLGMSFSRRDRTFKSDFPDEAYHSFESFRFVLLRAPRTTCFSLS